jgi:hypothetical protein
MPGAAESIDCQLGSGAAAAVPLQLLLLLQLLFAWWHCLQPGVALGVAAQRSCQRTAVPAAKASLEQGGWLEQAAQLSA